MTDIFESLSVIFGSDSGILSPNLMSRRPVVPAESLSLSKINIT